MLKKLDLLLFTSLFLTGALVGTTLAFVLFNPVFSLHGRCVVTVDPSTKLLLVNGERFVPVGGSMDMYTFEDLDFERTCEIASMAGLNTIELHVAWAEIEVSPGRFDWSRLDEMLEAMRGNRMYALICFSMGRQGIYASFEGGERIQMVPLWVFDRSDVRASRFDGVRENIADIDNPYLRERKIIFVEALVQHLKDRPNVLGYCAMNEPGYVGFRVSGYQWLSYSDFSREAFLRWLKGRFYGDIQRLNRAWGSDYRSFDEINLPPPGWAEAEKGYKRNHFQYWLDFREDDLAEHLEEIHRAIRVNDPDKIIYVKLAPDLASNRVWGQNPYKLARLPSVDVIGIDLYPPSEKWLRRSLSYAPEKPIWLTEFNKYSYAVGRGKPGEPDHMMKYCRMAYRFGVTGYFWFGLWFAPYANDRRGLIDYQHRPTVLLFAYSYVMGEIVSGLMKR